MTGLWLPRNLNYYLKGGASLAANHVAGLALGLLTTYLFTAYTGPQTYATFGYVVSILAVASLAALPGIDTAVLHAVSRGYDGALAAGVRLRLRSSFLGTAGMLAWAAVLWLSNRRLEATAVAWCSLLVPLLYPFASIFSYLQGRQQFGPYTLANLAVELAKTAVLALAVLVLGVRGTSAIVLFFLTMALSYVVLYLRLSPGLTGDPGPDFRAVGRNLTGAAALAVVAGQLDRLIVGTFFGPAAMAPYNLAFTLTEPLRGFGTLAGKLLFPEIVRADASAPLFRRKYGLGLTALAVALAALVLVYWQGFPLIQPLLFPGYEGAVTMIRWLIVATALAIFDIVAVQALWGLQNLRAVYVTQTIFPIQRILLLAAGAGWRGLDGILLAQVAHYTLAALVILFLWLGARRPSHPA